MDAMRDAPSDALFLGCLYYNRRNFISFIIARVGSFFSFPLFLFRWVIMPRCDRVHIEMICTSCFFSWSFGMQNQQEKSARKRWRHKMNPFHVRWIALLEKLAFRTQWRGTYSESGGERGEEIVDRSRVANRKLAFLDTIIILLNSNGSPRMCATGSSSWNYSLIQ